jgi:hypothetical protein
MWPIVSGTDVHGYSTNVPLAGIRIKQLRLKTCCIINVEDTDDVGELKPWFVECVVYTLARHAL